MKVTKEPRDMSEGWSRGGGVYERCCFCNKPTPYWYTPKDVAVCQECAKTHKIKEVPTKTEWFQRQRNPQKVTSEVRFIYSTYIPLAQHIIEDTIKQLQKDGTSASALIPEFFVEKKLRKAEVARAALSDLAKTLGL